MKSINCETSNCEHNIKCKCLAGIISVGDNAKCKSRLRREGGALAQSFADVEAGEEFYGEVHDSVVQCASPCALNSSGICSAETIDVKDVITGTKCKTRIPPVE
jgi:hypothetical protein